MQTIYDIALVGATGAVGKTFLALLSERKFPVRNLYPLASKRSENKTVEFGRKILEVQDLAKFDFSTVQIAFFSAGSAVSAEFAPKAAEAGCIVIDNTAYFRQDPDVPLIIPEVNAHCLIDFKIKNIIANPNCSTIQLLVALKPLYDKAGIKRIDVATYQSVSGAGLKAISELIEQTGQLLNGKSISPRVFPVPIAFNLFPHIGDFQENGYTSEEMKMIRETQKILEDNTIEVNPTAVRVPVLYGHSEAVHVELKKLLTLIEVKNLLKKAPGVILIDKLADKGYPTPSTHLSRKDAVFVGRIRKDLYQPSGVNLWIVADNIRKGAALNAIQIAEILIEKYL